MTNPWDVIVVGGGLAGLTTGVICARAGRRVLLLEQATHPGGRARTFASDEFQFNLGAHALYSGGAAKEALDKLGISYPGHQVGYTGSFIFYENRLFAAPKDLISALRAGFLTLKAKGELIRFLARLPKQHSKPLARWTVNEWLAEAVNDPQLREFLHAMIRVSTYTNAPDLQSAENALSQLQIANAKGVMYLDGGWQSLVDALQRAAIEAGVCISTSAHVLRIEHDQQARGVVLANGDFIPARALIVAIDLNRAAALLPQSSVLQNFAQSAVPVRAACLDIGLRSLPFPERTFALGMDRPLYYSVHSRWAKLSPAGTAVIHVAKYLAPGEDCDVAELESFLEAVQPGWRNHAAADRFLPQMIVNSAIVTAAQKGYAGRPRVDSTGIANVYLAGDYVGPDGYLADASFASAYEAAHQALSDLLTARRSALAYA